MEIIYTEQSLTDGREAPFWDIKILDIQKYIKDFLYDTTAHPDAALRLFKSCGNHAECKESDCIEGFDAEILPYN